ncbi:hypothetical protein BDY19DRAFT_904925 [Irpex rosettiformis]|uniref:Uncharacterized protein n=1 Tax=Irpex rosettiformis TaxID=378272 RepID=A0ACB8U8L5_9APHY|nr:hypothetical protein BDY19DRAFT_904925 [Irpex rosettiformis]
MLGKRKEREGDDSVEQSHGSTIFVSNLPYSATSTDLKTLFSDIGPVRSAFVVLEQGTDTSKGVGYVSFAIREDAQLAVNKATEGSGDLVLDGRSLRVQWAGSKPLKDRHEKNTQEHATKQEPSKPRPTKQPHPSGPKDPLAIRTIFISGLPSSIDSKTLWKKVRKYEGAEKVEWPAKINSIEDASAAHVLFSTPSTAQEAVNKLHAHVFKGSLLSVTLKKRLDGLAKPVKPKATKTSVEARKNTPAPSRANRLIVRNLPFDITEQDLRAVFLPYGPIHSIHIPMKDLETNEEGSSSQIKPKAKGYAFVWMLSKKDAEKALEGANGTKVRVGLADGLVRHKQLKKKLRREEAKREQKERERKARGKGKEVKQEGEEEVEGEVEVVENEDKDVSDAEEVEEDHNERVIAVDWALSKDKWEEEKAKLENEHEEVEEDEEGSEDDESSDSDESDSHIGVHDGSQDSDSVDDSDETEVDEEETKPGKPQLPQTDTGTTLFVRNVPFEATEDELRMMFRAFGPLRYARITLDHETGRSRGTGFACFWNKEDADKAIEQSEILRRETVGNEVAQPKKNPFKLPSLLTPDPSASVAKNLVLHGRTLDVIRAVTRDEAGKLKEAGERQREKADKRNLYLLREGIILPNTPAAENLPPAEVEKRTTSFNARRALLRSNPSLYVSRTRLSIRQLPLFVTERMLKRLATHAIRTFEAEVKAGTRTALSEDELTEPLPDDDDPEVDVRQSTQRKSRRKQGRNTGVKQTKIVRQQDRIDPVTGKGRSKGYGFLELEKHPDALRVLRWANNNLEVGELFGTWWKEELEDLVKIERKKEKKEEGRLERLKQEIEGGPDKKKRGTLIVEFSIENIQVVKRRVAHQEEQHTTN